MKSYYTQLRIDELKYGLPWLPLSLKMLFTGYLLAIGLGLLVAGAQIMLTHGMADGKFGLSVDDIVYSYYGNREGTTIEAKLNGTMKDKAPPEIRIELIKWARKGAPQKDWDNGIHQKIQDHCVLCHNQSSFLPDFTKLETLQSLAKADTGESVAKLTAVSHIHLFGISFIFMLMGLIFVFSIGIPQWLKAVIVMIPFLFLILDILSWWLTKYFPGFAWVTIIGGFGYTFASTAMWCISLYQLWILPKILTKSPPPYTPPAEES
ncbi:MAG TPA: elongation factor-1 alpha [Crenotrichaceae bacterium]|nr:elongation factor-1 alpha [Crenotrichaceae bacterium]